VEEVEGGVVVDLGGGDVAVDLGVGGGEGVSTVGVDGFSTAF
jgi:hypothetical protein